MSPRLVVFAPPAIHTTRWVDYFRGLGWRVDWISYGYADEHAIAHVPQLNTGRFSLLRLLRERGRVRRLLNDLDPDLVHAHWFVGPAWLMSLITERPFIVTAWGSDVLLFGGLSQFRRSMARRVGRTAAAITYDSESQADAMAALGVPRERLHRMVMGPDSTVFKPGTRNRALLERLGAQADDPIVIALRGVDDVYEPETVLRGFAAASRERPCTLLFRVGSVQMRAPEAVEGSERQWEKLRRLIEELGIADRVIAYEGVDREELPVLLASSDVFLSVPNSDGTSVALLEALFCEVPVIVSELPANREWIPDASYGAVVPIGDADALADALVAILDDLPAARERGRSAGQRARPIADGPTEYGRVRDLSMTLTGS